MQKSCIQNVILVKMQKYLWQNILKVPKYSLCRRTHFTLMCIILLDSNYWCLFLYITFNVAPGKDDACEVSSLWVFQWGSIKSYDYSPFSFISWFWKVASNWNCLINVMWHKKIVQCFPWNVVKSKYEQKIKILKSRWPISTLYLSTVLE